MTRSVCAVALLLAACQQDGGTQQAQGEAQAVAEAEFDGPNAAALIRAGDPKACAHAQVKEFIQRTINEAAPMPGKIYASELSTTQEDLDAARAEIGEVELSNFQALGSDPQTGQLLCQVAYTINGSRGPATYTVQYFLRQSLENDDDFIMSDEVRRITGMYEMAIVGLAGERVKERTPEPEPEPGPVEVVNAM